MRRGMAIALSPTEEHFDEKTTEVLAPAKATGRRGTHDKPAD